MEHKFQKILTFSITICMVLGRLSASALAADGSARSSGSAVEQQAASQIPAAVTEGSSASSGTEKAVAPEAIVSETAHPADRAASDPTPVETPETLRFFISLSGDIYDTTGNIKSRSTSCFSGTLAETTVSGLANSGYTIADFPADDGVFAAIQNDQKANFYFKEKLAEVTAENYDMKWYVLKKEGDCWHIDGVLVKKFPHTAFSISTFPARNSPPQSPPTASPPTTGRFMRAKR